MDIHSMKTAEKYGKLSEILQLERALLSVRHCEKVEFDLNGFYDNMNQVIILPFYDIMVNDPQYYSKRTQFKQDIIKVCNRYRLTRTEDTIEDYGSCFYMVFQGINGAWRTPGPPDELPPSCFSVDPDTGELKKILRGIDGAITMCVQFKTKELNQRKADKLNADMGVTKKQVSAMVFGSLFGWDKPGASPKYYTVSGTPLLRIIR